MGKKKKQNSAATFGVSGGGKTKRYNRNTKASVFENLFSDVNNLLELYKVLHPEDEETTIDDLEYMSLTNIVVIGRYNDLGFIVRGKVLMVLAEAQSVWSPNIIPREIMYLAETWNRYFTANGCNIYGRTAIELPIVEMYVIYTGTEKIDKKVITLSEEFYGGRETAIEVKVNVVTYRGGSDIIDQYISFCRIFDEQMALNPVNRLNGARKAIKICIKKDILREYLQKHEGEVIEIMAFLYSQEQVTDMMTRAAWRDGNKEGRAEGKILGTIETYYEDGQQDDFIMNKIVSRYGISAEEAREYMKEAKSAVN